MRFAYLALLACAVLLASCASPDSGSPATAVKVAATPLKVCQAAVDVMTRYSYSLASTDYPSSLDFTRSGNARDSLSQGDVARIRVQITAEGPVSLVGLEPIEGTFDQARLKTVLQQIKAGAESL